MKAKISRAAQGLAIWRRRSQNRKAPTMKTRPKSDRPTEIEIAYCLVSRDDWPEWHRINTDVPPDADYDTWLKNVEEYRNSLIAQGIRPVQIDVQPAEFIAWCRETGRNIDSSARSTYAATRLIEINKDRNGT